MYPLQRIFISLFAFSVAGVAFAGQESTFFTYDGKDFIRSQTTFVTEDGKSAVNTKLDHNQPAYKALIKKHSYTGEVTVFGQKCDAKYAPLTDANDKLTGALFVAMCTK
jgi:methyl-accepting chemotaxis protein